MKKIFILLVTGVIIFAGCTSTPTEPGAPVVQKAAVPENPAAIDFGPYWTGTIRMEKEADSGLGENAEARFDSEWTSGEDAGNVYPKQFTLSNTEESVAMNFRWDDGGDIPAGTYDAVVDIDGMPGTGKITNLKLDKGTSHKIYIVFKAAKINISLETDGDEIYVYPAGVYAKYKGLGRLNNIPKEVLINHFSSYTENNAIWWLIPAGIPLDIHQTHSDGTEQWITDYTAIPESFVNKLP